MKKIGLIGGQDIAKYTIADVMWERICEISNVKFTFEIKPIENRRELYEFYWHFIEDDDYIGFNVALPWKNELVYMVDRNKLISLDCPYINTVFKDKNIVKSRNTDVHGIIEPLRTRIDLKNKNVLLLGCGGAGYPSGVELHNRFGANVSYFDIKKKERVKKLHLISTYKELCKNKFDVIINATPVGKFYFNTFPQAFCSPIDAEILYKIAKRDTIIQEMNYFPYETLIIQLAKVFKLRIIHGVEMLVYQAIKSYSSYFKRKIARQDITKILNYIRKETINREKKILNRSITSSQ